MKQILAFFFLLAPLALMGQSVSRTELGNTNTLLQKYARQAASNTVYATDLYEVRTVLNGGLDTGDLVAGTYNGVDVVNGDKVLLTETGDGSDGIYKIGTFTRPSDTTNPPPQRVHVNEGLFAGSRFWLEEDGALYYTYRQRTNSSVTISGAVRFSSTNNNSVGLSAVNSNALPHTNFVGVIEMKAVATMFHNAALASEWSITNRIGAATTIVETNTVAGQILSGTVIGEASGGTSRVVTFQPDLGHLVANLDDYSGALALTFSVTLTNGNALEWSDSVRKLNGTNVHKFVTRQFKF